MKKINLGTIDRFIRIAVSGIIGFLYFTGIISGVLGILALVVGIYLFATAALAYCPLYKIAHHKTCSTYSGDGECSL